MKAIVIGSGSSGSNVALTLLEKGANVEIWDVGFEENLENIKNKNFHDIKYDLDEPEKYFLGKELTGINQLASPELFTLPKNRKFFIEKNSQFWDISSTSFNPTISLSKGGLANGWGANVAAFKENDISDWPLDYAKLDKSYESIYKKIPITSTRDNLSDYIDTGYESNPPVKLSSQDEKM